MSRHKQITNVSEQLTSTIEPDKEADSIIKDYEELNEKCDTVITKIKSRKKKSKKPESDIAHEVK